MGCEMSKEMTEQFFKATLKAGTYYVLNDDGIVDIDYYGGDNFQWNVIKEVLAPVPSYDEWEELQEASDGLSKIMFKSLMDRFVKADEERERLEDRLKEAEKVIKFYADAQPLTDDEKQMTAEKYHLVYGLKAMDYLEKYKVEE
jgi:hypothetical protein